MFKKIGLLKKGQKKGTLIVKERLNTPRWGAWKLI